MALGKYKSISAVLYGLEQDIASELAAALAACGHRVNTINGTQKSGCDSLQRADIIFCRAEVSQVQELKGEFPESPVVVASRIPEVSDWLDALEAGASDYCAAPFEPAQIRWVLRSHVPQYATA